MIVKLSNILFQNPNKIYSEWDISDKDFKNILYHFNFLEYRKSELHEYVKYVLKKDIPPYTLNRLLIRNELYHKAQKLLKKGEKEINIIHFSPHVNFIKQYYDN